MKAQQEGGQKGTKSRGDSDQGSSLHDGLLAAIGHGHGELREVHEHLRHLIAALAAAHVDDPVAVAVLAQRLTDHRLAAPKRAWDGARPCAKTQERSLPVSIWTEGSNLCLYGPAWQGA